MTNSDRVAPILAKLKKLYPEVHVPLHHRSPFELLVATILSAQCTDQQVNAVTAGLFQKLNTPKDFAEISVTDLEQLIRPTGFYRNKARHLQGCARALLEQYAGQVPASMEKLLSLPGVGRKTANCVLGGAFGIPGVVVDTHVARISRRLGLTASEDPVRIESDLMQIIPQPEWTAFSLRLIYFGRAICKARKPDCLNCPLYIDCPWPEKPAR